MNTDLDIRRASVEDLAAMFDEHGHGLSEEQMKLRKEPLANLKVAPEAFQFRISSHRPWAKERHVRNLLQALGYGAGRLSPQVSFIHLAPSPAPSEIDAY